MTAAVKRALAESQSTRSSATYSARAEEVTLSQLSQPGKTINTSSSHLRKALRKDLGVEEVRPQKSD
jgi:hypothetical protein